MTQATPNLMDNDPFLWLEDISGEDVLEWVRQRTQPTLSELCDDRFEQMRAEALDVLDADTRIPDVGRRGDYLYDFWRDAQHPRGVWRRTTLEQYRTDTPGWDVLVDVDALAAADDENWVWTGIDVIEPGYTRGLVGLSRGGSDAVVVREFDLTTKQFVSGGFTLPEAKSHTAWEDENTVLVGTDFGEGSLTDSGYPRLIKRWRRGEPLYAAETVYSGLQSDVVVGASVHRAPGFERTLFSRRVDFFNTEVYEIRGGKPIRIDVPSDASLSLHRQWLLIALRSDWPRGDATYRAGSLLVAGYEEFLTGTAELRVVFEPDARTTLMNGVWTRDRFVLGTLADVASRVEVVTPGIWRSEPVQGVPPNTQTVIADADHMGEEIFLNSTGFLTPSRLLHGAVGGPVHEIKSAPAFFDVNDLDVSQHFAGSADGTSIPYFSVTHRDADGPGPTLLAGYGGFGASILPSYDGVLGRLWLARGGNFAAANIRGGGEYGPTWHQQAVREGRHKSGEDFAAVAQDLVTRGVTTAEQLGAAGSSNGGLLMGIMLTRYPELFGALACSAPLLDMRRFHLLLAGASWVAEYGDPDDPADWEFLQEYSPYHNISADGDYPPVLITTSTRDDRVHPGHGRKMTAALEASGHRVWYYEKIEGGHGGAADNAQAAFNSALTYEFLHRMLNKQTVIAGLGA